MEARTGHLRWKWATLYGDLEWSLWSRRGLPLTVGTPMEVQRGRTFCLYPFWELKPSALENTVPTRQQSVHGGIDGSGSWSSTCIFWMHVVDRLDFDGDLPTVIYPKWSYRDFRD